MSEVREDFSEDRLWGGLGAAGEDKPPRECGKGRGELRCKGPEGRKGCLCLRTRGQEAGGE